MGVVSLPHPAQVKAEEPWHSHVVGCIDCRDATRDEHACDRAQRLHEDAVQAAHEAHAAVLKAGHEVRLPLAPPEGAQQIWQRLASHEALLGVRTTGSLPGLDISKYQQAVDFDRAGTSNWYIISKASEGVGYVDPYFARNWTETHRIGRVPGSYHFSRPDLGNSPEAEADFFLSVTGDPKGTLSGHDAESSAGSEAWCRAWRDHFVARTNFNPGFYSYLSWIKSRGIGAGSTLGQSWLWLAWPDSNGTLPVPEPWASVAIQQYNAGPVPGISGQCDLNRFAGTLADLRVLAGAAPKRGIRHMRVIEDGHGIDYITNGVEARGIGEISELRDLLRICGQDAPEKVGQYTLDRMVGVASIPANQTRPVVDPWALAADARTSASYGGNLGQLLTSVDQLGKAIHNGGPTTPIDINALAQAIVAKLPTANDPKVVAEAVAAVLAERLGAAPDDPTPVPTPTPAPVPSPTPAPTGGT